LELGPKTPGDPYFFFGHRGGQYGDDQRHLIFSTGGDQILVALELTERKLPVKLIAKISRLDLDFVTELSQNLKKN